ncbi:DUF6541 family protein [Salana multivorans]
MSWIELAPAFLLSFVVFFGPGLLIGWAAGLRGPTLYGFAPAISTGIVGISAIAASIAGVPWGILPPAALAVAAAAVALGLRALGRRFLPVAKDAGEGQGADGAAADSPAASGARDGWLRRSAPIVVALGASALLLGWRLVEGMDRADGFSQTYDNNFHLNGLRWILDTHDASSLTLGRMTSADGVSAEFYPAAWHAMTSLVGTVLPVGPAPLANASTLVIGAFVWPASALALAALLTDLRRWAVVPAALLLAGFPAYPYLMVDFGILYPNFLGYALVPSMLAAVAWSLGLVKPGPEPGRAPQRLAVLIVAVIMAAGVGLAHPSAAMLVAAMGAAAIIAVVAGLVRRRRLISAAALLLVAALVYPVAWDVITPELDPTFWKPTGSSAQAVGEALLATGVGRPAAVAVAAFAIAGVVVVVRKRIWWLLGALAILVAFWVIIAGWQPGPLRDVLTSVWYNDPYRFAGALPLLLGPLAVVGFIAAVQWLRDGLPATVSRPWRAVGVAALVVVAVVGSQQLPVTSAVGSMNSLFRLTKDSPLVSSDELALIEELPDVLPPDAIVAVDPYTGGALAYAFAGVHTTSRHVLSGISPDQELINDELADAEPGSPVCDAVEATGVTHVLDFGAKEVHGGDNGFHGIRDLRRSDAVELVTQVGDARLYAITACG